MAGAVTATLRADITQFEKALGDATTKITGLQKSTSQVNAELKKFGNEFSGANLIRQANTMAKAVEDIGGASRLTAAEQKKLGGTVDEALAKYRALGQEVPPALAKISTELKTIETANAQAAKSAQALADAEKKAAGEASAGFEKAGGAATGFKGLLGGLGGAITGAFTIGALVNFGKSIVELGGQITDLSQRTGLSVEAVQEFKYAADQSGSSIETFAGGVQKLSEKLGDGGKGTVKALKELGLSFETLRTQSPEEAFTAVADALGKVDDSQKQAALGTELMGKKFFEILPTIKAGFSEVREEARKFGQVLSKEDVAALDAFGDKFGAVMTGAKVAAAKAALEISSGFKLALQDIIKGFDVGGPLGDAIKFAGTSLGRAFVENFSVALKALPGGGIVDAMLGLQQRGQTARETPKAPSGVDENDDSVVRGIIAGNKAKAESAANYTDILKAAREELGKLSAAERQQIKDGDAFGDSNEEIAESLNKQNTSLKLTAGAIGIYLDGVKQATSALKEGFVGNLRKVAEEATKTAQDLSKIDLSKLTTGQLADLNKKLYEGVQAFQALGQESTPAAQKVRALAEATFKLQDPLKFAANNAKRLVDELTNLSGPTLEPWFRLRTTLGDFKYDNLQKMLSDIPKVSGEVEKWAKQQKVLKDYTDANKKANDEWNSAIRDTSQAFANLAQIGGDGLKGFAKDLGEIITLIQIAGQAGKTLGDLFSKISIDDVTGKAKTSFSLDKFRFGQAGQSRAETLANYGQGASAIVQGGFALAESTNVMGRGNRAARGAATGAAIGTKILPGYGTLVGAGVGALIGALRNPAFEDVFKKVAKNFGVNISEETAKGIAKVAKDQFKGDRGSAEVFSLDTIIGEGGGIKDSNVKQLQARLRDAFSLKEVGKFSKDQLDEVLTKNFGAFATYVDSQTTIASKGFAEILQLAEKFDATTEEMRAFVSGQAGNIGSGIGALAQPLVEQSETFKKAKDDIAALKAERDKLLASPPAAGGSADIEKLNKELKEAADNVEKYRKARDLSILGGSDSMMSDADDLVLKNKQLKEAEELYERVKTSRDKLMASGTLASPELDALNAKLLELQGVIDKTGPGLKNAQAEFDRLGIIALAGFNAARDSGLGFVEALTQIGPGLDQLIQLQKDLGLEGSAALTELLKFRDLVEQNQSLVTSAEGLNEVILALSKIGGLTAESFKALEEQGVATFDRLTGAGFSSNEALQLMSGFLENARQASVDLGIPIDENTAKLIEQAEAAGILKASGTDMVSVLKEGLGALIEAVGGQLPAAWAAAAAAATTAGAATTAATTGTVEAVNSAAAAVGALPPALNDVGAAAQNAGAAIGESIPAGAEAARASLSGLGGEALDGLATRAQTAGAALGQGISDGAIIARGSLGDLRQLSQEELDALSVQAAESAAALAQAYTDAGLQVGESLSGMTGPALEQLQALAAQGDVSAQALVEALSGAAESIASNWGEMGALTQEELAAFAAKGQEVGAEIVLSLTDGAKQTSDAWKIAGLESAKAVAQAKFSIIADMEKTGKVTADEAVKMRKVLATQFEEAVKSAKASLAKIPKDIPIDVNFNLTPFPDLPDQPPVVIPVEFEYPDDLGPPGQRPDNFPDGFPGGASQPPPSQGATDAASRGWRETTQAAQDAGVAVTDVGQAATETGRIVVRSGDAIGRSYASGREALRALEQQMLANREEFVSMSAEAVAGAARIDQAIRGITSDKTVTITYVNGALPIAPDTPPVVVPVAFQMSTADAVAQADDAIRRIGDRSVTIQFVNGETPPPPDLPSVVVPVEFDLSTVDGAARVDDAIRRLSDRRVAIQFVNGDVPPAPDLPPVMVPVEFNVGRSSADLETVAVTAARTVQQAYATEAEALRALEAQITRNQQAFYILGASAETGAEIANRAIIGISDTELVTIEFLNGTIPDPPNIPPIVVPVEFEMPDRGQQPWEETSRVPGAALGGVYLPRPGGTVIRVAEAGRAERVGPVDELQAAPTRTEVINLNVQGTVNGQELLRFTSRNLPRYISTRTTSEAWRG